MRIVYFPVSARAEASKMMAAYAGIPLPQVSCEEFFGTGWGEAKGLPSVPFGQLPLLELDDKRVLGQSGAIDRYVAGLCKLLPEDPVDLALANSYYEAACELVEVNMMVNVFKGADYDEKKTKFFTNVFPTKVANLNKALGSGPYMGAASSISFADFLLHHHLSCCLLMDTTCLDAYPNMKAYVERVGTCNEGVKTFLATRLVPTDVGVNPHLAPQTAA